MKKGFIAMLTLLAAASFIGLMGTGYTESKSDVVKLFEEKCGLCHEIERPKEARKTAEEWKITVERMKGYAVGLISDEEAKKIEDFLAKKYSKGGAETSGGSSPAEVEQEGATAQKPESSSGH